MPNCHCRARKWPRWPETTKLIEHRGSPGDKGAGADVHTLTGCTFFAYEAVGRPKLRVGKKLTLGVERRAKVKDLELSLDKLEAVLADGRKALKNLIGEQKLTQVVGHVVGEGQLGQVK